MLREAPDSTMNLRLVALLSVCISALRALKVYQPYRIHASDGQLQLECSYHLLARSVEEVHVTLYRGIHGNQRVCSSTLNLTASWQPLQEHQQGSIRCSAELKPSWVDLLISGLQAEDTDFYRCKVEVLYPPPYQRGVGNGTLLYIQETPSCPEPEPGPQIQDSTERMTALIPAAMIAVIIVCIAIIVSLIVKTVSLGGMKKDHLGAARVAARRLDCRFGYENFL